MNIWKIKIILIAIVLLTFSSIYGKISSPQRALHKIIKAEKNAKDKKNLNKIINFSKATYKNLYKRLKNNESITIFIDPAHGKTKSGFWQGKLTGRLSSTGKPEEFYSILISREFYKVFSKNRFITIDSTKDFLKVMKGTSESYRNISFHETITLAKKSNSFMLMSQHLNNVSYYNKAFGHSNIRGVHIIKDYYGRYIIKYIPYIYQGYLTLYNIFDTTGFSRAYAVNYRNIMTAGGIKANNWQSGAVADDRFNFFFDYPIGVIFETAFISNPLEEKKLRDTAYIKMVVRNQYNAFLNTFKQKTGIDISQQMVKKYNYNKNLWCHIALNQIALYYIKTASTKKAKKAILYILKSNRNAKEKKYYSALLRRVTFAESTFFKAHHFKKKAKRSRKYKNKKYYYRLYKKYLWRAFYYGRSKAVLYSYKNKYLRYLYKKKPYRKRREQKKIWRPKIRLKKVPIKKYRPLLLVIDNGQSLKKAVQDATKGSKQDITLIAKRLKLYRKTRYKRKRFYSKKKKRYYTRWIKRRYKIKFHEGIYIIYFKKNFRIKKIIRKNAVPLDPRRYQNFMYLKNSYFAQYEKEKSI